LLDLIDLGGEGVSGGALKAAAAEMEESLDGDIAGNVEAALAIGDEVVEVEEAAEAATAAIATALAAAAAAEAAWAFSFLRPSTVVRMSA
jgi:dihydrodipicolinate synthase/N-acetylneuraminate lyase